MIGEIVQSSGNRWSIMIMTIHHQAHTRHIAVHRIIQVAVMEAAVIHQKAILSENTTAVATHQEANNGKEDNAWSTVSFTDGRKQKQKKNSKNQWFRAWNYRKDGKPQQAGLNSLWIK